MSEKLQRFQARARELARSGKFNGWHPIAFELQFEEGFTEAIQWTYSRSTQEELDITCRKSRNRLVLTPPSGVLRVAVITITPQNPWEPFQEELGFPHSPGGHSGDVLWPMLWEGFCCW